VLVAEAATEALLIKIQTGRPRSAVADVASRPGNGADFGRAARGAAHLP
jgi:hypothetical protein